MNKILFDIKISPVFTGVITYLKENYVTGDKHSLNIHFKNGEIIIVAVPMYTYDEHGLVNYDVKLFEPKRWNSEFWKKAPKYANFDDCSYVRTSMSIGIDVMNCTNSFTYVPTF